jgi:hypothetical protein
VEAVVVVSSLANVVDSAPSEEEHAETAKVSTTTIARAVSRRRSVLFKSSNPQATGDDLSVNRPHNLVSTRWQTATNSSSEPGARGPVGWSDREKT